MILKTLWAHRKQNGFIFVEIAFIAFFTFYLLDELVVSIDSTYFNQPAGEFEKEHLVVGLTQRTVPLTEKDKNSDVMFSPLYAFRDAVQAHPDVQSVCLTEEIAGAYYDWYKNVMSTEADTTRTIRYYTTTFQENEHFFETMGLRAVKGSPSAEELSKVTAEDEIIITRSLARQLFGTDQVVGRRVINIHYSNHIHEVPEFVKHYTIAGVVEDVKPIYNERYCYIAFFPKKTFMDNSPWMLIRLKPGVNAKQFVEKNGIVDNNYHFQLLFTYKGYLDTCGQTSDADIIFPVLGSLGLVFILNVILGTLGTFWLQIRKRTEDIGIMRSFGAKRRNIFWMIWGEGALLTLFACIVGQIIWLQFAINGAYVKNSGMLPPGTGETDWVSTFWLHFLIICVIQFLLMLVIVTIGIITPSLIAMYKKPVNALRYE